MIAIGHGRYAFYAHLQTGSITVRVGDRVKVGQTIARLGNSGNSSGPHLHFQLMDGPLSADSEGIPFRFTEFNLLGKQTSIDTSTGQITLDTSEHGIRHDELPLDEQVVDFGS